MATILAALWIALAAAQEPDDVERGIARMVVEVHRDTEYPSRQHKEGGALLALGIFDHLKRWDEPPPPPEPEIPEAAWLATSDLRFLNIRTGEQRQATSLVDWMGADHISSVSQNRQPMPGFQPGDVLLLGPGVYQGFRISKTYDLDIEAIKQSPTRLGDPVNYPNKPFTYWTPEAGIVYGLNNRDEIKGSWAYPADGYPAWFQWGIDPMTWIRGTVGRDGVPRTVIGGGRTYGEWIGAVGLADLILKGPSGSVAILQFENPVAHDANGVRLESELNWPHDRTAVRREWQGFRDIALRNVWIDGEYDFRQDAGPRSKWGLLSYELGRSSRGPDVPGFSWIGGGARGIFEEHAGGYHHNTWAESPEHMAMLLKDLHFEHAGRTALQFTARDTEGPGGQGRVVIEDVTIRDVCLQSGGGGSAITIAANHEGLFLLRGIDCQLGGDPDLHPRYRPNITGGFVSHAGGGSGGRWTREIRIEDSRWRVGPHYVGEGSARRANLQVGAVHRFALLRSSIIQAPGAREAIRFDPATIGELVLDPGLEVEGDVAWGGIAWRDRDAAGDGRLDGDGWRDFVAELRDGADSNGDGVVTTAGAVALAWSN